VEDWVQRALDRWPRVPALFGWLALDRRGRWLIRGETISRPQIIDTINRNYAADEHGRWFFQNGPQRGYIALAVAPFVLRVAADGERLLTHTGLEVREPRRVLLDEEGSLLLLTEHGVAALADHELDWALSRLRTGYAARCGEDELADALAVPSGAPTALLLEIAATSLRVERLDREHAPEALGFVREPQPRDGEKAVVGGGDEV
jgi:hypothetical protein